MGPGAVILWVYTAIFARLTRGVSADAAHTTLGLTTTGPPALPEAPRVAYVLRRRPDTTDNPLHDLVADQIQTSFRPHYNGAPHR